MRYWWCLFCCALAQPQVLQLSTYLGGSGAERGLSIAALPAGGAWVGSTDRLWRLRVPPGDIAVSLTTTAEVRGIAADRAGGAVVALPAQIVRYDAGGVVQYQTAVAGSLEAVAVDADGNAIGAGVQTTGSRLQEVYVVKVAPSGRILWEKTFGGDQRDEAFGVAADAAGNIYVGGRTFSSNFTLQNALQGRPGDAGLGDGFLVKLSPDGQRFLYATYLGWEEQDFVRAVAVTANGVVAFAGFTNSLRISVRNAFQRTYGGGMADAFVGKLSPEGNAFEFLSYYGGSDSEVGYAIAMDGEGGVLFGGETPSANLNVPQAAQPRYGGKGATTGDGFVARVAPGGVTVLWATYAGGRGDDLVRGVAIEANGCAWATGDTVSADFPVRAPVQPALNGATDAFALRYCAPAPPRPAISAGGVVAAASFGGGTLIAPGSWVEIYGTNLAPETREWSGADFQGTLAPTALAGVRVRFGSQDGFLRFVSPTQVNAQAPAAIGSGPLAVRVINPNGESDAVNVTAVDRAPGLLAPPTFQFGGVSYAVAILPDGAFAGRPEFSTAARFRPAAPQETVVLFAIGCGAVSPPVAPGQIAAGATALPDVSVLVGSSLPLTSTAWPRTNTAAG